MPEVTIYTQRVFACPVEEPSTPEIIREADPNLISPDRFEGLENAGRRLVVGVKMASGHVFEFVSTQWKEPDISSQGKPFRASLWAELCRRFGQLPMIVDKNAVPTEVAMGSKAAVVAYLVAARGYDIKTVSDEVNLSEATVEQYLTDFRSGNR